MATQTIPSEPVLLTPVGHPLTYTSNVSSFLIVQTFVVFGKTELQQRIAEASLSNERLSRLANRSGEHWIDQWMNEPDAFQAGE